MCARLRQCGRGGKADTASATGDKGASSVKRKEGFVAVRSS